MENFFYVTAQLAGKNIFWGLSLCTPDNTPIEEMYGFIEGFLIQHHPIVGVYKALTRVALLTKENIMYSPRILIPSAELVGIMNRTERWPQGEDGTDEYEEEIRRFNQTPPRYELCSSNDCRFLIKKVQEIKERCMPAPPPPILDEDSIPTRERDN